MCVFCDIIKLIIFLNIFRSFLCHYILMTLNDKNTQKNVKKYVCKKCDFYSNNNNDFRRHLHTIKHNQVLNDDKMITMDDENNSKNSEFVCNCGKKYKYRQGMHVHKKNVHILLKTII